MNSIERTAVVRRARVAEIQAIAIYEAETYWIREASRRKLLLEILEEEREHDQNLTEWGEVGVGYRRLNRFAGWVLGTLFSGLPWGLMCRLQAWAEREAARVYARAHEEVLRAGGPSALVERLAFARDQELAHAARFDRATRVGVGHLSSDTEKMP